MKHKGFYLQLHCSKSDPIKIVPRPALRVGVIHTTAGKLCDSRRSGDHNIFLRCREQPHRRFRQRQPDRRQLRNQPASRLKPDPDQNRRPGEQNILRLRPRPARPGRPRRELPELPLRPERQHHRPDRSERRRHRYIPVRPLRRIGKQNWLNRHPLPLQRTGRGDDR